MTPLTAEKIAELERLLAAATAGPWMLATSCSWRRVLSVLGESVIVPITQRSDNHPDLACGTDHVNAELAIAAVNALPALLSLVKRVAGAPVGEVIAVTGSDTIGKLDTVVRSGKSHRNGTHVALVEIVGGEE